jgi:hypothetical protein
MGDEVGSRASTSYFGLVGAPTGELRRVLEAGETPDVEALVGWEYRGTNRPATTARLLGIRRFIKGFTQDGADGTSGYNISVDGTDLSAPWAPRPQRDGRLRFGFFTVGPPDAGSADDRYPGALLLDYGAVPEPERGIAGRLRDHLVRVSPGSDDLLLGRAYLAFGTRRVPVAWFVLERLQPVGSVQPYG